MLKRAMNPQGSSARRARPLHRVLVPGNRWVNVIPRWFRVFVDNNLWHEHRRVVQRGRVKEVHIRQLRGLLQHRTAACLTESAAHRVATVSDLLPKSDLPGDFRLIDRHRKLGGVTGTGDALTLPAMANEREFRARCCRVPDVAASTLAGDSFGHVHLPYQFSSDVV